MASIPESLFYPEDACAIAPVQEVLAAVGVHAGEIAGDPSVQTIRTWKDILPAWMRVDDFLREIGVCKPDRMQIACIYGELADNGVSHGNNYDPAKVVKMSVSVGIKGVVVAAHDQGQGPENEGVIGTRYVKDGIERGKGTSTWDGALRYVSPRGYNVVSAYLFSQPLEHLETDRKGI